jgi:multidrug efflux pump subunit AcrA (membrane-fusion protein)
MKKKALLMAILIAVSAIGCSGCSSEADAQEIVVPIYETDKIDYKTETAQVGDISQKYYVDGSFDYPYSENVSFKIDGTVESVEVEENDSVKKGDLLCVLNSDDLDAQLEEKQLYLDQSQKTLDSLKSEGGSANEIALAEAELELVQLEYQHLEDSLEDYKVYAPCDGIFRADKNTSFGKGIDDQRGAQNLVIEGASVKSGQIFGTVSDHSQQYLVCDVYDNELENVNFGTRVSIEQGATEAQGKVVDVIDESSDSLSCYRYVILPDEGSDLSELGVQCIFEVYSRLDTVIVPSEAVKTAKDRTYVNVLIDDAKIEQDVEVGIIDDDETEILSGLSGGEEIIIN